MKFRVSNIPVGGPNRPNTKLASNVLPWITVHETANRANGADAEMHRVFVWNGGGSERVSFHFVVDDVEAVQLLPLDEIGWHAGDGCDDYPTPPTSGDIGCFASVAIETCVNADGNWAVTKQNIEELIAMIIRGDDRIDWGDGHTKGKFNADRIAQHNAWSGKDCPHIIRAEGSWPTVRSAIRSLLTIPQSIWEKPLPIPSYDGRDKMVGKTLWHALSRIVKIKGDTTPRVYASESADKAANRMQEGQEFESRYIVKNGTGQWWYVSKEGFRILMSKCAEQFRPMGSK